MTAKPSTMRRPDERVDWVDYAKGFCIVFVAMMHSTYGVEAQAGQTGWLNYVVAFTAPFRIPDFFLISGLFLARRIDHDWRFYLDRKVVHFAYFLVLWVAIDAILKGLIGGRAGLAGIPGAFAFGLIEPPGALWFIQMLAIFFVVAKLLRQAPVALVLGVLAALEIAHVQTGIYMLDQFCARAVYFFAGYYFARHWFALAAAAQARVGLALLALALWGVLNGMVVFAGYAKLPGVSLVVGLIGCGAVIVASALMSMSDLFAPLRACGKRSIVVFLAFVPFMVAMRAVLLKTGVITDIGTISLLVTLAAVLGPLILQRIVAGTPARFLFERPQMFKLRTARPAPEPAE